jgi:hypothetical protein
LTGAAPVPSLSLPPFSTIIASSLPAGSYVTLRDRQAVSAVSAAFLRKGYQPMSVRRMRLLAASVAVIGAVMVPFLASAVVPPARAQFAPPAPFAQPVQLAPPPAGLARVWFLRQFQPGENLSTPWIYVNGAPLATSIPGTIFYRDFPPGIYTFTVDSCGRDVNQFPTVQLGPGTSREFEVQSLQSFTPPDCPRDAGTFYVRPVQPRFLQLYLPQLSYLGPR